MQNQHLNVITKLQRSRNSHISHVTRKATRVSEISASQRPFQGEIKCELETINQSLQRTVSTLEDIHNKIIDLLPFESEVVDQKSPEELEEDKHIEHIDNIIAIQNDIKRLLSSETNSSAFNSIADHHVAIEHPISQTISQVKLLEVSLQSFSGDVSTYQTFIDLFYATVHNNQSISDIEKLVYLRSVLKDSALRTISGLSLTAANYTEALQLLHQRYGSKVLQQSSIMDKLANIQAVKSSADHFKMREFHDSVKSYTAALECSGQSLDS